MTEQAVRYFALVSACNARVAAMAAANQQRAAVGDSVAYTSDHFYGEASNLEAYAQELLA